MLPMTVARRQTVLGLLLFCGAAVPALGQPLFSPVAQERSVYVSAQVGASSGTEMQSASNFGGFFRTVSVERVDPDLNTNFANASASQATTLSESTIEGEVRASARSRFGSSEAISTCDVTFTVAQLRGFTFTGTFLSGLEGFLPSTVLLEGPGGVVINDVVGPQQPVDAQGSLPPGQYHLRIVARRATGCCSQMGGDTGMNFALALRNCPPDFNDDGFTDPDDLADFITCFFLDVASPGLCAAADYNTDGLRNPDDLSDFITAFFILPTCH